MSKKSLSGEITASELVSVDTAVVSSDINLVSIGDSGIFKGDNGESSQADKLKLNESQAWILGGESLGILAFLLVVTVADGLAPLLFPARFAEK